MWWILSNLKKVPPIAKGSSVAWVVIYEPDLHLQKYSENNFSYIFQNIFLTPDVGIVMTASCAPPRERERFSAALRSVVWNALCWVADAWPVLVLCNLKMSTFPHSEKQTHGWHVLLSSGVCQTCRFEKPPIGPPHVCQYEMSHHKALCRRCFHVEFHYLKHVWLLFITRGDIQQLRISWM